MFTEMNKNLKEMNTKTNNLQSDVISDNVKWVGQGPSDNVKQKNITKWARSK